MINDRLNKTLDPRENLYDKEFRVIFVKFCALICILSNKKLNLANIFLLILKDDDIKNLYMGMCEFSHEYEGLKCFLEYDSSLHKSKYIKKYLNANCMPVAKKIVRKRKVK